MGRGLDLLGQEHLLDDAVLVNHEGGAEGAHVFASVHALLAPHAHGLHQFLVGVGNQGEAPPLKNFIFSSVYPGLENIVSGEAEPYPAL